MEYKIYLDLAKEAAISAGSKILDFYLDQYEIVKKKDGSPITSADEASHKTIISSLKESGFPIVSEESDDLLLHLKNYWLVDPLDGTKDFIAKNDEFTVNVALMINNVPTIGIVYAPALGEIYLGHIGAPPWKEIRGTTVAYRVIQKSEQTKMAVSRFHDHPDVEAFAIQNNITRCIPMGSSLKYVRMAFGEVDICPRLVGSAEWDTAAAQAILEAANGKLIDWHNGESLRYGKPRRRNTRFLAFRHPYENFDFFKYNYPNEVL